MSKNATNEDEFTYKNKTLHYRVAEIVNYDGAHNLEELLRQAINKHNMVSKRYLSVLTDDLDDVDTSDDKAEKSKLFINHNTVKWGILFFDLLKYSDDTNVSVVTIDDSAEYLDIQQMAASKADDGRKREFLDSVMYAGVFKNHIAVIQSASLRTRELEAYINWFLADTGVLTTGKVILKTEVTPEIKSKLVNNDTKSVKIGAPLIDTVNGQAIYDLQEEGNGKELIDNFNTKSIKICPKGRGLDMLMSAFDDDALLKAFGIDTDLLVQDAVDGSDIQVSLELTYKRKATKNSQSIINSVSTAMRHSHPDDVVVELDKVGKLTGNELSIKKTQSIRYYNGVIDSEDLYMKIKTWMKDQISLDILEAEA